VAIGVDDEAGDPVELVARGGVREPIDLGDRVEHDLPALDEQLVEDLLLRIEVVVDEPVRDAGLVGHVGDAAVMEPLPREDGDGCIEDETALVHGAGAAGGGHQLRPGDPSAATAAAAAGSSGHL
jgi:hypothetical protein